MRLSFEELENVKKKYNVDELWSFSKFDTYRTSKFEWMLKYLQKVKENNDKVSAYASLGGMVHDSLERFYNGEQKYENLATEFDDNFTTMIDVAGLCFDRCDSEKNDNIKNKYYKDLIHYFNNFTPIQSKTLMEQFVSISVTNDIVFQGYIDCMNKDEEGNVIITDFKTSSKYSPKALIEHSAQLVLYAEGLRQKGIPKNKIRCRFMFLKYVDIDCEQVNGKIKTRTVERYEIGNSLQASAKVWLKKLGYENDMIEYLDALAQSNDINSLPSDVASKYVVRDCEVCIDDIWDIYDNLKKEIIDTVSEIREKIKQYNALKSVDIDAAEHLFWDDEESLKAQSYYYNNLSGYNIHTLKPFEEYLNMINAEKNGDVFGNIINPSSSSSNVDNDDDLSWLNDL